MLNGKTAVAGFQLHTMYQIKVRIGRANTRIQTLCDDGDHKI